MPPGLGVADLAGFVALAKARGEGLAYGHSGPGQRAQPLDGAAVRERRHRPSRSPTRGSRRC
ncbi:hypothetical protein [Dankookia sp. P2]|uniref:hypothetical protein n=1 Tax=Dankookia sp. P2 TaxID=3423955 RepID=UPI003D66632C